ncbi:MAG: lipoate--protein ligase family protein [Candidatus Freyarchaeota archaeon]|nr:lipoate--protein ligase family protein [Candidatus Jordarchaeia archaeon]MBS7281440.1 lipoate--protein ligase family protein [Candidatus Jordarchaeia archaeon]
MTKARFVVDKKMTGVEILVLFGSLPRLRDADKIPNTLFVLTWDRPSVSLGKYEDLDGLKYENLKRDKILIGRRPSGAGILWAPPGGMGAGIVVTKDVFPNIDTAERIWAGEIVTELYRRAGISDVWYKHPGDVKIGERKLSGTTCIEFGKGIIVGSFINRIKPDTKFFEDYLIYPEEKLKDKMLKDITEYAASIETHAPKLISEDEVAKILQDIVREKLGLEFEPGTWTQDEKNFLQFGMSMLTDEKMVTSVSHSKWYSQLQDGLAAATYRFKTMKLISANVAVDKDKRIRDILITGDFLISPAEGWEKIMESLKGLKADDEGAIKKAIRETFEKNKIDYSGFTLDDMAKPVIEAGKLAIQKLK